MSDFEDRLSSRLVDLVSDVTVPASARTALAEGLRTPPARRRRMPQLVAAAVALVAVAFAGANVVAGADTNSTDVAAIRPSDSDESSTVTTSEPSSLPATEAAVPHRLPPFAEATTTTTAEETVQPLAPPSTVSPTPACRNSTSPSCGPFRWDPDPVNQPATLTASMSSPVTAGEPAEVTFTMSDPDGPVTFDCVLVNHDGRGTALGACSMVNPSSCQQRFGPWDPPAPVASKGTSFASVVFEDPGVYTVTVEVSTDGGCPNVDPYRSSAATTFEVKVDPA